LGVSVSDGSLDDLLNLNFFSFLLFSHDRWLLDLGASCRSGRFNRRDISGAHFTGFMSGVVGESADGADPFHLEIFKRCWAEDGRIRNTLVVNILLSLGGVFLRIFDLDFVVFKLFEGVSIVDDEGLVSAGVGVTHEQFLLEVNHLGVSGPGDRDLVKDLEVEAVQSDDVGLVKSVRMSPPEIVAIGADLVVSRDGAIIRFHGHGEAVELLSSEELVLDAVLGLVLARSSLRLAGVVAGSIGDLTDLIAKIDL